MFIRFISCQQDVYMCAVLHVLKVMADTYSSVPWCLQIVLAMAKYAKTAADTFTAISSPDQRDYYQQVIINLKIGPF